MPDWSYQTVFRPYFFSMRPEQARGIALGGMGRLARLPLGRTVIRFMGHMAPDRRLAIAKAGLIFPGPSGLGADFDPQLQATPALADFGFGFLEVGPVAAHAREAGKMELEVEQQTIRQRDPQPARTPIQVAEQLQREGPFTAPVIARIEPSSPGEASVIVDLLEPHVDAFSIELDLISQLDGVVLERPLLLILRSLGERLAEVETLVREERAVGVIVAETEGVSFQEADTQVRTFGAAGREDAQHSIQLLRETLGEEVLLIGGVGVHSPADALDMLVAGADLVKIDTGLVFAGPGLPKRINEAVLYQRLAREELSEVDQSLAEDSEPPARIGAYSWFWTFVMGLSMFVGGVLALAIACTRVVLPYDESSSGLTRDQLMEVNPHLLSFMTHDRVTLAGTMLAVGIQYLCLSWWGIRRGVHWAYVSVLTSAFAGAISFFSFLGFGYFDPFHAFATAILFQFLLLAFHSRLDQRTELTEPDLHNDIRWRLNQWGQMLFVIHGAVLIVAGLVISKVGLTTVFVPEDLEFMHTSADHLISAHPQLVPLVAHDRATFGGMLISCGVATLLPALWGFRRGQAWLWWALVSGGSIAYLCTITVHWCVGYTSLKHLLPAYFGLLGLWIGGALTFPHLVAQNESLEAEWDRRRRN